MIQFAKRLVRAVAFGVRATFQQMADYGFGAGGNVGYKSGKIDRLNNPAPWQRPYNENQIPSQNLQTLQHRSWSAFRDDPYFRKAVRAIVSKVIGCKMTLSSQATGEDGKPDNEIRRQLRELWDGIQVGFDYRGLPGQGGQTMAALQRVALQSCILSGGVLFRLRSIDEADRIARGLPVRLVLQLVDIRRLADQHHDITPAAGNFVHRGIEFTKDGTRVRYWLRDSDPTMSGIEKVVPVSAAEMSHLFWEDDVDQLQGSAWGCASLPWSDSAGNLTYNVLKAFEMQACAAMGVRRPSSKARFGLNGNGNGQGTGGNTSDDLTDINGNTISALQPGMIVDLGEKGELQNYATQVQAGNPEAFVNHVLRGVSAGMPATKASTVIGDYRQASFSSEKSADNDIWSEVDQLQEWFAAGFMQVIYETVVRRALLEGYFGGSITSAEFLDNPRRFTRATWNGPKPKSINPEKDEQASTARMKNLKSSPVQECDRDGIELADVIAGWVETIEQAEAAGLPEEIVNTILGVPPEPPEVEAEETAAGTEEGEDDGEDTEDTADTEATDGEGEDKPRGHWVTIKGKPVYIDGAGGGKRTAKAGTAFGGSHTVSLPSNPSKLNMATTSKALSQMGLQLGPGKFDFASNTTSYSVTEKATGKKLTFTASQLKTLVYSGEK